MIKVFTREATGGLAVRTEGLRVSSIPEIEVAFVSPELIDDADAFLLYVADYLLKNRKTIRSGETMSYGYWLTKFESLSPDVLEVWEYNAEATEFVRGASLALTYWRDQHAVCKKYHAVFQPPRPDQLTIISEGVLEGRPVQGVRYPPPDGMSGWWITTDRYNGEISSLKHQHTYHVTSARPDLARFMALPIGYRYDISKHEDVWFDQNLLADK